VIVTGVDAGTGMGVVTATGPAANAVVDHQASMIDIAASKLEQRNVRAIGTEQFIAIPSSDFLSFAATTGAPRQQSGKQAGGERS